MLPEGSDKFGVLHTFFTLNRRPNKEINTELTRTVQNSNLLLQKMMQNSSL
jgi:hypothetical protein